MKHCSLCQRQFPSQQRYCPDDGQFLSIKDPYNLVGRTLVDKYRIDALAALGGMAAVYSAHHLRTDRRVAFKILQPNFAVADEEYTNLFEREAKLASQFIHENIALVFDAGQTDDSIAYIAMEWVEGHTLEEIISRPGELSLERIADIFTQIASALDTAHDSRIIHRDLKPSNIMITRRQDGIERVKVLDFGIGKILSQNTEGKVSVLVGTPYYASPEQFVVGARIDGRSDIYSLGVILYEMITGELPFKATSLQELIQLQEAASPPSICDHRPDVSIVIGELVNKMLSRDVENRPRFASDVAALFKQALSSPEAVQIELSQARQLVGGGDEVVIGTPSNKEKAIINPTFTVYKYAISGRSLIDEEFTLELPIGARILCVQMQHGSPCIWALVNPNKRSEPRCIVVCPTGFPMRYRESLSYIGTFQLENGAFVYHLFEDMHFAGSSCDASA